MPQITLKVRQGIIHVNSVSVLQKTDEVICLSADCRQKYPEYWGGDERSIYLGAKEGRTRVDDPNAGLTEIMVEGLEGRWQTVCETGRYEALIVLVKVHDNPEAEWGEDDWVDYE